MKTSESKGRPIFFTKRIDSHNESNRFANWNALAWTPLRSYTLPIKHLHSADFGSRHGDAAATRIRVLLLHISLPVSSCGHWCIEEGGVGVNPPPSHRLDQRKFFHRVIWPTLCTGSRYKHHQFNHSCD